MCSRPKMPPPPPPPPPPPTPVKYADQNLRRVSRRRLGRGTKRRTQNSLMGEEISNTGQGNSLLGE